MKRVLLLRETQTLLPAQLASQLEEAGFSVKLPEASTEAWFQAVQDFSPDVVVMEVLPEQTQDRYQFCKQLRTKVQTENIPVLLVGSYDGNGSGRPPVKYLLDGIHAGANDYLQTPYDMAELVEKINLASRLKQTLEHAQLMSEQLNTMNEELYVRNIHVEKELYVARQLQQSLLPKALDVVDENDDFGPMYTKVHHIDDKLKITGIYFPCDALGGDLYDVLKLPNGIGVSISDVSGHGVPAGFVTAIFKASMLRLAQQYTDPSEVLFHLNNELYSIIKTGDYVTGVYLHIDMDTMTVQSSGAGHPYPFYYEAATGKMHRLQKNGTPLVWVPDMDFPKDTVQLKPGDKIYLFTDGVSELNNPHDEMFGEERVERVLLEAIEMGMPYITDHVIGSLSDFTEGASLGDDISMVMIEALDPEESK